MKPLRHHKLLYTSSPDRGLDVLLFLWPDIKQAYPDATLDICYGWQVFDMVTASNPERQEWKSHVMELMKQDGITDHGKLGKAELKKLRQQSGIWAYPTYFTEINCINALEMQSDGVAPVTMNYGALAETVQSGIKVDGDIYDSETKELYLKELLSLMGDEKRWKEESEKGIKFAKSYDWNKIAHKWTQAFAPHKQDIKVSIITPTIRRGFWNIMANNIKSQSYTNLEWIIVDDYKEDRSHIAREYAKKYDLNIVYVRGKKRKIKRTYGLVNANNTGLQTATGELLVILQDFVLMPLDGVEQLVMAYRKFPDALIAPVDMYFSSRVKPDTNSEDWFNGELDVVGEFMRSNVRIKNEGMRFTDHPYDFEQNYGAIPMHIAKDLGGWYEFYDEGLGFDNTEIAYRALKAGYRILLDETNVCICIDHWNVLKGTEEHGLGREKRLSDPRFIWEMEMIEQGILPLKRTQEVDDQIELLYTIPEEVAVKDAVQWMRYHTEEIVTKWYNEVKL